MSRSVVIAALMVAALAGSVRAQGTPAGPIRIAVQCEALGRTKACPAFLLGFVDANKVLLSSPRGGADVVLYVAATQVTTTDKLHLRFVGTIPGAPPVVEIDVDIDTRGNDDAQRAQLLPAFLRGIALFVGARHPAAVTVALTTPAHTAVAVPETTPWGAALAISAVASYTERYRNYDAYGILSVSRLDRDLRLEATVEADGSISRQPPLTLEDGTKVSLNTREWGVALKTTTAKLLNDCYSVGTRTELWKQDPKAQYRYGFKVKAGVEWDRFPADDPRGNRLAVMYFTGYQIDGYNVRNELGERFAHYPIHGLVAAGTIRRDKIGYGLSVVLEGEVIRPMRRHSLSASPFIEVQLGAHVDVNLSVSATKRELPAPDEDAIDPADFELLSRLSYAEPLSINGSFTINIHFDRTNGARNDRLTTF